MKLSNKILLSIFVFVVVSIITLLVKIKLDIGEVKAEAKSEPAVNELSLPQFESITLRNNVGILLVSGSEYALKVTGPAKEDVDIAIDAQVNDGNLELNLPENHDRDQSRHKIQITTPMVKKIILNDNAEIKIENLSQDSLEVVLSDISNLVANEMTLDHFLVEATDKTRIRSHRSTIQEIEVKLSDRSECRLFELDGGSVTGQVRHSAELRLSGWTEKLSVDMDKKARVIKRD